MTYLLPKIYRHDAAVMNEGCHLCKRIPFPSLLFPSPSFPFLPCLGSIGQLIWEGRIWSKWPYQIRLLVLVLAGGKVGRAHPFHKVVLGQVLLWCWWRRLEKPPPSINSKSCTLLFYIRRVLWRRPVASFGQDFQPKTRLLEATVGMADKMGKQYFEEKIKIKIKISRWSSLEVAFLVRGFQDAQETYICLHR